MLGYDAHWEREFREPLCGWEDVYLPAGRRQAIRIFSVEGDYCTWFFDSWVRFAGDFRLEVLKLMRNEFISVPDVGCLSVGLYRQSRKS